MIVIFNGAQTPNLASNEIQSRIEAKVRLALGRYESDIEKVNIQLEKIDSEENEKKIRYVCMIRAKLTSKKQIEISETARQIEVAISACIRRIGRYVKRAFYLPDNAKRHIR